MSQQTTTDEQVEQKPVRLDAEMQSSVLDQLLRHVEGVADRMKLHVTDDGLSAALVDEGNVTMHDITIPEASFTNFTAHSTGKIGVPISEVRDMLKAVSGYGVGLTIQDREIIVRCEDRFGGVALIDPHSIRMAPDVPHFDLPVEATLPSLYTFTSWLKDHRKKVYFTVTATNAGISFDAEADDGPVDDPLLVSEEEMESFTTGGRASGRCTDRKWLSDESTEFHDGNAIRAQSIFTTKWTYNCFEKLLKAQQTAPFSIELGTEFPMKIHHTFGENVSDREAFPHATVMVAPRIMA